GPVNGKTKSLARDKAPLLFELVDKLAALLNAEAPKKITVDGNTSLHGSMSTLLIGLPLAASCTVDQLAGMIAHECGRHVKGTAAGTAGLARGIRHFFFRAVKQREAWDEPIDAATTSRRPPPAATGKRGRSHPRRIPRRPRRRGRHYRNR